MFLTKKMESSACGVGFVASRKNASSHDLLAAALHAARCVEHRGACGADNISADGAGIMTDIPFEMFGYMPGSIAVATLFMPTKPDKLSLARSVFEETFSFMGMEILDYRDVPVNLGVLGPEARASLPTIKHAFIKRPAYCRTDESFNKLLYAAKQCTRTKERARGIINEFFFTSLSTTTIVYKGLIRSESLDTFYLDLANPAFKTRFALFHRRFSTNTRTSWDKAQPFRLIGHNGEINTIAGNRSWSYAREQALGVPVDELLTHEGISDSGSLNEMVEALKYRSSIPRVEDILAIMMPPADLHNSFYRFWSRAMEPWDGPALITYSDGDTIGARLDRNGFRPCRWLMTDDCFYVSSEAGSFHVDDAIVLAKGTLAAGSGVTLELSTGKIHFEDPSQSRENYDVKFDPRLSRIPTHDSPLLEHAASNLPLFSYTDEDCERILTPMAEEGKEPIGSMGDTARIAILSTEPRSFFDFFSQDFAQVTNPPLDYLREAMVTDLITHIGRRPNIFAPKELIPPAPAIELASPVLSLGYMNFFSALPERPDTQATLVRATIPMVYRRDHGPVGFRSALREAGERAVAAVREGASVLVLSHRGASTEMPPVPSLLVLRSVANALNREGINLDSSIIVECGEAKRTHDVAALIAFGATAVCPFVALEFARSSSSERLSADQRERNLLKALESGVLKIMSKMGISVVRSYQGSMLFTAVGLSSDLIKEYFPRLSSPIGGLDIDRIARRSVAHAERVADLDPSRPLKSTYQFKEHNRGASGEKHSMTNSRSRLIHQIAKESDLSVKSLELYENYLKHGEDAEPITVRHLLALRRAATVLPIEQVAPVAEILATFGSGAMSFGAISAEAQRDIIIAMKTIGGRSNSGEGGENPYYYVDGTSATIKQVASGRFGVTAEYLVSAEEIQIKVAQGAKPGEGGQLMGVKVTADIARARHSNTNVDLISPPPLHDIYSIEDLKELIYELKQLKPDALVSVKLVSGANIGTIAVGVAKAGADVIHVAGHDGGTGAATLSSMKHAGLPWELGLSDVHRALLANGLRSSVTLRVDGGLHTGRDIVVAAMLGAEQFEFGKLLLIAEGCVMARICEKNTCPAGIATHDEKFKAKYKGSPESIVRVLTMLAEDVRRHLSTIGATSLREVTGRGDLLEPAAQHRALIAELNLNVAHLLECHATEPRPKAPVMRIARNDLNSTVLEAFRDASRGSAPLERELSISTADRAALASVSAEIAATFHAARLTSLTDSAQSALAPSTDPANPLARITFRGSAGQGFCVFLTSGIEVSLFGEANDSVCKSMSGGSVVIRPSERSLFAPETNSIIGNCALYGATGGTLFVHGLAGDRFGVRNSGATAVVEGVGLHACEYMTNGTVVILGPASYNIGSGMTGGTLYLLKSYDPFTNRDYIRGFELDESDLAALRSLLSAYVDATGSRSASEMLSIGDLGARFLRYRSKSESVNAQACKAA